MINIGKETRLTDELERQLMMKAIEDQYRFKPVVSLKKLFAKFTSASGSLRAPAQNTAESTS